MREIGTEKWIDEPLTEIRDISLDLFASFRVCYDVFLRQIASCHRNLHTSKVLHKGRQFT